MNSHEINCTAKEVMQSVVEYMKDDQVRATQVFTIRTIPETERKLFVKLLHHWMHKNRVSVFLLTDNILSLQIIEQYIKVKYAGIRIVATATLDEDGMSDDKILNRINGAEADCVIVSLPKETEELFVEYNRMSLNSKLWLGLGSRKEWPKEKSGITRVKELVSSMLRKRE